ncbi:hypothetical protein Tco_1097476 [Tanacetum coccineum]
MTSSNNQMHNDIMAVGSKERPPMLASGSYAQWKSRFMRYVDTKPNRKLLRNCIYEENRKLINAKAEAIHMILNGIGNDIYCIVDACPNAEEMWIAIERLQQGESINIQDVKTKLFWEFGKFTSKDGESIESYYTRNANPLALLAATQQYLNDYYQVPQAPKPYKTHARSSRQTTSIRSHATTRSKGK